MALFKELEKSLKLFQAATIPSERKENLAKIAEELQIQIQMGSPLRLNFICTHNSRRSHLSQIWAQIMAYHFGIAGVHCYSAGTEATALFPAVVKTMENLGLKTKIMASSTNPIYALKYSDNEPAIIGFSKTLEDDFNPKSDFYAFMTCSQAAEDCPFVPGAKKRYSLSYEDPKVYDNSDVQMGKYQERSLQIGQEMFFLFSKLHPKK